MSEQSHAPQPDVPPQPPFSPGLQSSAPPSPPQPRKSSGLGIAAMVLSIIAFVFAWIPFVSYAAIGIAALGLVLGIVGFLVKNRSRGTVVAGAAVAAVALIAAISMSSLYTAAFSSVAKALDDGATPPTAFGAPQTHSAPKSSPARSAAQSTPSTAPKDPASTTAAWAAKHYGSFAVITKSGTGDSVVTLPAGAKAGIVTATHSGSANFALQMLAADNSPTTDLLVNTIGAYQGTTAFGMSTLGGDDKRVQITADGAWTLKIAPIAKAPGVVGSGRGDHVFLYHGDAGTLTARNHGEGNFVVSEYTDGAFSIPLLINEIGAYHGSVPTLAGPAVLVIESDGDWTISTR